MKHKIRWRVFLGVICGVLAFQLSMVQLLHAEMPFTEEATDINTDIDSLNKSYTDLQLVIPDEPNDVSNKLLESKIGENIEQEIESSRTEFTKQYRLKNGNIATVISPRPIHYETVNGELQEISFEFAASQTMPKFNASFSKQMHRQNGLQTAVQKSKESFAAPFVPFGIDVSKKFIDGYMISKDSYSLAIKPIDSQEVSGKLNNKNQIVYMNAWHDTDVLLEVNDIGIEESIILKSSNAPNAFTFQLSESLSKDFTIGELAIQPTWLIDAVGERRSVKVSTQSTDAGHFLSMELNTEGLVYPVHVSSAVYTETIRIAGVHVFDQTLPYPIFERKLMNTATPDIGREFYFGGAEYMRFEYGLIKFDLGGFTDNSAVIQANLIDVDHWGVLDPPSMITQSWGNYVPSSLNGLTLEEIVERWMSGTPNEGLLFSSNSYPIGHDWSIAMLYIETNGDDRISPTNLSITQKAANSITLEWFMRNPNEIKEYLIYEGNQLIGVATGTTRYVVPNITIGRYSFSVKAKYKDGYESVSSNIVEYLHRNKYTYKYNQNNQLIEIINESGTVKELVYDKNGNLITIRNKN